MKDNKKQLFLLLRCNKCSSEKPLYYNSTMLTCNCGNKINIKEGIVNYTSDKILQQIPEVEARDEQAEDYLLQGVFPTQIDHMKKFIDNLPTWTKNKPVLDLGCGPGPFTSIFLKRGYKVVGVDFSKKSLVINNKKNQEYKTKVAFIKADLNKIRIAKKSVSVLIMCNFLQHLGSYNKRALFLKNIFKSLITEGFFILTFLNFNLKNLLKKDRFGSYSKGKIKYERLSAREVIKMLPKGVKINSIVPMNISNKPISDRILSYLPGARYLSRMILITGRKI